MKRILFPTLSELKKQFTPYQLRYVKHCRDDIRGIKLQYIGEDEDYIQEHAGDYLSEIYEAYQGKAADEGLLTPREFDKIYKVLDTIYDKVDF